MRVHHVGEHPKPSATKGGKALAEKIRDLNAQFPKPYLLLLNAPHMRQETGQNLLTALQFFRPPVPRTGRTLLTRDSHFTDPPRPPVYSLRTRAIQKTRRLIVRLNELPGLRFFQSEQPEQASLTLLPIHYLGAALRVLADAIITTRNDTSLVRSVVYGGIANLVYVEHNLKWSRPGRAEAAPPEAVANSQAALRLFRQFASLPPEVLSRLRKCGNPRCSAPGPYFLQKIGPYSKHCSPKCKSLARTLAPTRRRASFMSE